MKVKDALRRVIETEGIDVLNKGQICFNMIKDLAPNDKQGIEDIKWAFDRKIPAMLAEFHSSSDGEKEQIIERVFNNLITTFNTNTAKRICEILVYSVQWNIHIPQSSETATDFSESSDGNEVFNPLKTQQNNQKKNMPPVNQKRNSYLSWKALSFAFIAIAVIGGIVLFTRSKHNTDNPSIESTAPQHSNNETNNSNIQTDLKVDNNEVATIITSDSQAIKNNICHLGVDITSYEHGVYYEEYSGDAEKSFSMGGHPYNTGFTIGTYPEGGYASFNLDGKYSYISGKAGNFDNKNYSVSYVFYGDGNIIGTVDIIGGALPIDFDFSIEGVKQLKIVADQSQNYSNAVGFADVILSDSVIESNIDENEVDLEHNIAYLGKDIKAYDYGTYYEETNGESNLSLGGLRYHTGFKIGTYADGGYAIYNIEGKYTHFSGIAGNVDHTKYGVSYAIYGDAVLIGTVDVVEGGLPVQFDFDVTNVKQLKIVADGNQNYSYGVGFANAVLYNNENDIVELYAKSNYPERAYLGKNITAYQNGTYYQECANDGENVTIQGKKYYNGFKIGTYPDGGFAYFNLNSEYSVLSGKAGFIENVHPISYILYGDGIVIGNITISSTEEVDFSFDVSGVKQLQIVADGNSNYSYAVAFAEVTVS